MIKDAHDDGHHRGILGLDVHVDERDGKKDSDEEKILDLEQMTDHNKGLGKTF
jgi:hypothetical protein